MSRSEVRALAEASETSRAARLRPPQLGLAKLTKYLAESITVVPGAEVPDCQKCGACCDIDPFIPIGIEESERMGGYVEVVDDSEPAMVVDRLLTQDLAAGRCAHLAGDLGLYVGCRAYDVRPSACRAFEAGSDRCKEIRRMYGLEPQLDEASVSRFSPIVESRKIGVITGAACVVDSISYSIAASDEEPGGFESIRKVRTTIMVAVDGDNDNVIELYSYDPSQEVWLQGEFLGMTIAEAMEFLKERVEQGVSN